MHNDDEEGILENIFQKITMKKLEKYGLIRNASTYQK
jgi:hypothetical protein